MATNTTRRQDIERWARHSVSLLIQLWPVFLPAVREEVFPANTPAAAHFNLWRQLHQAKLWNSHPPVYQLPPLHRRLLDSKETGNLCWARKKPEKFTMIDSHAYIVAAPFYI